MPQGPLVPQSGWFITDNPSIIMHNPSQSIYTWMIQGESHFQETSTSSNFVMPEKKSPPYHPVIHHGKFDDCPMRCSSQSGSCLGRRHAGGKAQLRGFAVPNDLPEMGPKISPNVDECGHQLGLWQGGSHNETLTWSYSCYRCLPHFFHQDPPMLGMASRNWKPVVFLCLSLFLE